MVIRGSSGRLDGKWSTFSIIAAIYSYITGTTLARYYSMPLFIRGVVKRNGFTFTRRAARIGVIRAQIEANELQLAAMDPSSSEAQVLRDYANDLWLQIMMLDPHA